MHVHAGIRICTNEFFVDPRPPRNMTIEKTTTNSVIVQWQQPLGSLLSEYSIRYRTASDNIWERLPSVQNTDAEVTDMTPGELYTIEINTVSYGLESNAPQQLNHTVRKNQSHLFIRFCTKYVFIENQKKIFLNSLKKLRKYLILNMITS